MTRISKENASEGLKSGKYFILGRGLLSSGGFSDSLYLGEYDLYGDSLGKKTYDIKHCLSVRKGKIVRVGEKGFIIKYDNGKQFVGGDIV